MTTAPMNPLAGPAGPGKYATRTDNLQMGSIAYGEGVETQAIKSGVPLAKTKDVSPAPLVGLDAPSQRPNEAITSGINMGAGPGTEALSMKPQQESLSQILGKMLPYDTNGEIAALYEQAQSRGL